MMTKREFYEELNTALTVGCSLPFSIPEKAIDNIVKYAAEWFYRNWEDGIENIYLSIPKESWEQDKEFQSSRTLTLPSCIYSVNHVAKDRVSQRLGGSYGADFSFGKYLNNTWGMGVGGDSGITSDALLGFVVASSWGDLTDSILKFPISFNYNRQTNKLFLKGSLEHSPDFLLECDVRAPLEALYGLDLFFNYCLGQCKMSLANILGTFGMTLPGNATINFDRYYDQGKEEVTEVKEEVKNMSSGSAFFLHTNGM